MYHKLKLKVLFWPILDPDPELFSILKKIVKIVFEDNLGTGTYLF